MKKRKIFDSINFETKCLLSKALAIDFNVFLILFCPYCFVIALLEIISG